MDFISGQLLFNGIDFPDIKSKLYGYVLLIGTIVDCMKSEVYNAECLQSQNI